MEEKVEVKPESVLVEEKTEVVELVQEKAYDEVEPEHVQKEAEVEPEPVQEKDEVEVEAIKPLKISYVPGERPQIEQRPQPEPKPKK